MKKLIVVACVLLIMIMCFTTAAASNTTTSEVNIPSETQTSSSTTIDKQLEPKERHRIESEDKEVLNKCLKDASERMIAAHQMADGARGLDYEESHDVIRLASEEWRIAHDDYLYYASKIEALKKAEEENFFTKKAKEYPVATEIWLYFKDLGYNDYLCAGLLGNFMAETGGHTLNIIWDLEDNGYYGMAQWHKKYFPGVVGCDLKGQCDFLAGNIEETFNNWGNLYSKGFNYAQWLELTNEKEAALALAKCYERCGSGSYNIRQKNANKAYKYFTTAPTADAQ